MATKAKKTAPSALPTAPVLSLAEIAGFTADQSAEEFGVRARSATKIFLEQGKLVYHIGTVKMKKGQSVYGLLQGIHGVSQGSIDIAVKVGKLIEVLVVAGHLPESRFDEVIQFRSAKRAWQLVEGKAAIRLAPEALAAILAAGTPDSISHELNCLAEHGQSIAEREAAETLRVAAE